MQKRRESIRLFENDALEKLSHVHPIVPLVLWGPVVAVLLWRSFAVHHLALLPVLGAGAGALLFWSFAEYILHRFAFHYTPKGKLGDRIVFIMHGNHHEDSEDPTRLVMPPFPAIVFAVIFYALFRLCMGPIWAEPVLAFFIVGYLAYDYIHYSVHHFRPRTRVGKFLKQYHMNHHFLTHDARWGVSSPLWDHVFGSTGSAKAARYGGPGQAAKETHRGAGTHPA